MTAKEMFEELGYQRNEENESIKYILANCEVSER